MNGAYENRITRFTSNKMRTLHCDLRYSWPNNKKTKLLKLIARQCSMTSKTHHSSDKAISILHRTKERTMTEE